MPNPWGDTRFLEKSATKSPPRGGATRCYQVPPAIFIENLNIQCAVSDMLDIQIVHSWLKNALNLIPVMYFDPAGSALSINPFVEEDCGL